MRLENPVRTRGVVGAGHDRLPPGLTTAAISGVSAATATRPICAPPPVAHMDDHRHAGDVGSGFPGRRVEAMRAGISTKSGLVIGLGVRQCENSPEIRGIGAIRGVYMGCQSRGKPISQPRCLCGTNA